MSFRMKKCYADKIRRDQAKYTAVIPGDQLNQERPEPVILKPAVDGSVIGRENMMSVDAPPKTGGMKIRKTPYYYADR